MERLTIRTPSGAALKMRERYPSEDAARNDLMAKYKIAMERLADYEDTELSPQTLSEVLDGVSDWYDAHGEGRLVVLPCKVGDAVWSAEPFKDGKLREGSIVQISVDEDGFCGFWAGFDPEPVAAEFTSEDIGKTVFFIREKAEKALSEEK